MGKKLVYLIRSYKSLERIEDDTVIVYEFFSIPDDCVFEAYETLYVDQLRAMGCDCAYGDMSDAEEDFLILWKEDGTPLDVPLEIIIEEYNKKMQEAEKDYAGQMTSELIMKQLYDKYKFVESLTLER